MLKCYPVLLQALKHLDLSSGTIKWSFALSGTSAVQAGTWLHEDCHSQFRRHLLIQPNYNSSFLFTNICLEAGKSLWMWSFGKQLQKYSCSVELVIISQIRLWNSASPTITSWVKCYLVLGNPYMTISQIKERKQDATNKQNLNMYAIIFLQYNRFMCHNSY